MENFTPITASIGGALIGLSAVWLMASAGRIAGISGILGGAFTAKAGDRFWRLSFLLGMVLAPVFLGWVYPDLLAVNFPTSGPVLIVGGILVGLGTQIGNGCTSGHGVCGIGRVSGRSVLATLMFMATGMLTVYCMSLYSAAQIIGG